MFHVFQPQFQTRAAFTSWVPFWSIGASAPTRVTTSPTWKTPVPGTGTSSTTRRLRRWRARSCSSALKKISVSCPEESLFLFLQWMIVKVTCCQLLSVELSQFSVPAETMKSQARKPKCGKGYHCSRNAYMLVYKVQEEQQSDASRAVVEVPCE